MKKLVIIPLLALTIVGCDRLDHPDRNRSTTTIENDNTGKNVRDRDLSTETPENQSESPRDRTITQRIREVIVADDTLSTNAKNIKIITINGFVTLRGPVATHAEKDRIANKIKSINGIRGVDNQLETTNSK